LDAGTGQRRLEVAVSCRIGDRGEFGAEFDGKPRQRRAVTPGGDRGDREPPGRRADHLRARAADRSGRPENGEPPRSRPDARRGAADGLLAHHRNSPLAMKEPSVWAAAKSAPKADAAMKASSLSMRPPWPGMRRLESLTPKRRFSADSNRSPSSATTEAASPSQNRRSIRFVHPLRRRPNAAPANAPATAPDQVLPGDTLGHNLGPPISRPAK